MNILTYFLTFVTLIFSDKYIFFLSIFRSSNNFFVLQIILNSKKKTDKISSVSKLLVWTMVLVSWCLAKNIKILCKLSQYLKAPGYNKLEKCGLFKYMDKKILSSTVSVCPTWDGGAVHESVVDEGDERPAVVGSVDQPAGLEGAGQGQG